MTSHTDAAHDRALLDAPDEYEDALHDLALLDHLLLYGGSPDSGPAFWLRLADATKLRAQLNGGESDETIE